MQYLLSIVVGMVAILTTGISFAQNGNMMNGGTWGGNWMGGGYGGIWMVILLVVVVGLVVWIVNQNKK